MNDDEPILTVIALALVGFILGYMIGSMRELVVVHQPYSFSGVVD